MVESAVRVLTQRILRAALQSAMAVAAVLISVAPAQAQFGAPPTTPVHDASALRPPAGARVAIVEFADMQCPDCANAFPLMREAEAKYHIPLAYHDFPLPMHNWSFQAAVNARWFEVKSKKMGDDYRSFIFQNQRIIDTPATLTQKTQQFAQQHGLSFPFAVDPQGKLTALVKADYALGQRIGIEHTPTIWVVTSNSKGAPFIEVVDRSRLFQLLDQALSDTRSR